MSVIFAIFAFVTMISIIVTIHEFGHYIAARACGLIATHFSIGFGNAIVERTDSKGTSWRIAPFLIGGYVKFPGDDKKEPAKEGEKTLNSLPRWQKSIVVGAGPAINLVLAALIFAFIAGTYGYPAGRPVIQTIVPGSPAEKAGLQPGDVFRRIAGQDVVFATDVTQNIMLRPNKDIDISYTHQGETFEKTIHVGARDLTDDMGNKTTIGFMGIMMPRAFERSPDLRSALTKGVRDGLFMTYAQVMSLKQIVTGERRILELSGPIRIAKMSAHTMSMGLYPFLYLMAILSIGVGIMNLLPVPGLDGGHLATYALESIARRDFSEAAIARAMKVGLVIIASMGVLGLTLDLISIVP